MSQERRKVPTNFNRAEAEQFCNFFSDDAITIQTFDQKKHDKSLARIIHGPFDGIYEELTELNSRGAGIFLMVNRGDGQGRHSDNVISIEAFFLDLDGAPLDPVRSAPILPHVIVESSPDRYQSFWKIEPIPVKNGNRPAARTLFERVQSGLERQYGGDHIIDLPRVMRVPGFYHQKYEPFLSRIVEINNNPPIHPKEFVTAFEITLSPQKDKDKPTENPPTQEGDTLQELTSLRLGVEAAEFCLKNKDAGRHKQALRLGYECRRE